MPKRSTKKAKPAASRRASWKGNLTFGLVSFEVEAFNALNREESDIRFHQLHAKCHRRIRYQKVCPTHGELTNDEIVSGYEVTKGHYVEIDPDELDELRTPSERALRIDGFVAPDAIDPLYYDGHRQLSQAGRKVDRGEVQGPQSRRPERRGGSTGDDQPDGSAQTQLG